MQALRIFLFAFSLFLLVGAPFSFHFFSTSLPFSLCFFRIAERYKIGAESIFTLPGPFFSPHTKYENL
jgi:hypothetical protein